ncbi:hypothetical protein [Rhodococcus chondri]|uniref:Permease n=1 Tax=Rhodococcus chondri TaxID=3065941 RepID=A0ABU7JQ14_9NOCA|nr:hypothetical protein [Rhodococcus sp. CC-R104]MEE2032128.1 hypothetical protein [Rhodococcus sp. CC-R104]
MSDAEMQRETTRTGMPPLAKRAIGAVVAVLVVVIAYFVLAAFVPRWWAQRIAGLAEGGISRGILWGLVFGVLCTAVPLVLLAWTWQVRGWRFHRGLQVPLSIIALLVAVPNLMTLSIVLGNGNAAHAGERILDVDAPGFRGASLVGAIIGVLVFVLFLVGVARYRKRGRDLRRARGELERQRIEDERIEEERIERERLEHRGPGEGSPGAPI